MKYGVTCLLVMMLLVVAVSSSADEDPKPSITGVSMTAQEGEVAVLRAQLELMREYDQRLLSTVYWSLGGLVTIATILIGFGWFANFRVYERDRNVLAQELRSMIQNELREMSQRVERDIENRFKASEERTKERVASATEALESKVDGEFRNLNHEILNSQYELKHLEADKWMAKAVYSNALRAYCGMMQLSLRIGYQWRVAKTLDYIHDVLMSMRDQGKGRSLDADDIRAVTTLLDSIPKEHAIVVSGIRGLLEGIRRG